MEAMVRGSPAPATILDAGAGVVNASARTVPDDMYHFGRQRSWEPTSAAMAHAGGST